MHFQCYIERSHSLSFCTNTFPHEFIRIPTSFLNSFVLMRLLLFLTVTFALPCPSFCSVQFLCWLHWSHLNVLCIGVSWQWRCDNPHRTTVGLKIDFFRLKMYMFSIERTIRSDITWPFHYVAIVTFFSAIYESTRWFPPYSLQFCYFIRFDYITGNEQVSTYFAVCGLSLKNVWFLALPEFMLILFTST